MFSFGGCIRPPRGFRLIKPHQLCLIEVSASQGRSKGVAGGVADALGVAGIRAPVIPQGASQHGTNGFSVFGGKILPCAIVNSDFVAITVGGDNS